jgi:hypothetical protein
MWMCNTRLSAAYKHSKKGMAVIGTEYGLTRKVVQRILLEHSVTLDPPGQKFKGGKKLADKKWITKNKERISNYHKNWQKKNRDYLNNYHKEWRSGNEKYLLSKREYEKERKANDPIYKLVANLRTAVYTNLKERGVVKYKSTMQLLGYTVEELVAHLEKQFTPGMVWENYGVWHVDHIRPLASGNESLEEVMALWRLENLQPLWGSTIEISGVTYQGNLNKGCR